MSDLSRICEDCGTSVAQIKDTVCDYAASFGESHKVCRSCYDESPEPDTGRPDWDDLPAVDMSTDNE